MDETMVAGPLEPDARSGASELLPKALEMLRAVHARAPESIGRVARAVGEAQPSMAPFWNAALAALREERQPGAIDRFAQRARRSAEAVTRVAAESLGADAGRGLHVVTLSFSGTVIGCLRALSEAAPAAASGSVAAAGEAAARLVVSCAEGRPALEGRRMAEALAAMGIAVEFHSDAAIGAALARETDDRETIVLIGADAVTPAWIVNKTGSGMLCAAARDAGVPVYVAAARDKFADRRVARLLRIVEHGPGGLWDDAPRGVTVKNAYFERMPIGLVSMLVTDAGLVDAGLIGEACRAASAEVTDEDIARLAPSEAAAGDDGRPARARGGREQAQRPG